MSHWLINNCWQLKQQSKNSTLFFWSAEVLKMRWSHYSPSTTQHPRSLESTISWGPQVSLIRATLRHPSTSVSQFKLQSSRMWHSTVLWTDINGTTVTPARICSFTQMISLHQPLYTEVRHEHCKRCHGMLRSSKHDSSNAKPTVWWKIKLEVQIFTYGLEIKTCWVETTHIRKVSIKISTTSSILYCYIYFICLTCEWDSGCPQTTENSIVASLWDTKAQNFTGILFICPMRHHIYIFTIVSLKVKNHLTTIHLNEHKLCTENLMINTCAQKGTHMHVCPLSLCINIFLVLCLCIIPFQYITDASFNSTMLV
jgi:hypothetical protein